MTAAFAGRDDAIAEAMEEDDDEIAEAMAEEDGMEKGKGREAGRGKPSNSEDTAAFAGLDVTIACVIAEEDGTVPVGREEGIDIDEGKSSNNDDATDVTAAFAGLDDAKLAIEEEDAAAAAAAAAVMEEGMGTEAGTGKS